MTEAEKAYRAAQRAIEVLALAGGTELDLSGEKFRALERIPTEVADIPDLTHLNLRETSVADLEPLAQLTELRQLHLTASPVSELRPLRKLSKLEVLAADQTSVSDLRPIIGLKNLKWLYLDHSPISDISTISRLSRLEDLSISATEVSDLRPIRRLTNLGTMGPAGLTFEAALATELDAELQRLSEIQDEDIRARETLAYLNTLPPWPEPYLPKARPDGKPPEWIGAAPPAPPAVRTAETQIRALLRHAQVTRISAAVFAEQIATALREVPATNGNELTPVLQIMAEVGEVLSLIARQHADARDAETRLRLRISQLETLVDRLTRQLADAEKALEAEKALARSEGFMAAYRKSFGEESGKWSARLVFVGVPAAMGHFLGLDNPVVEALNKVLEQLPKG